MYYCVISEFYDNRYLNPKAHVTERTCKEKPRNQYRKLQGMDAFIIWFTDKETAHEVCEGIRTGDIGIETVSPLFKEAMETRKTA